MYHRRLEQQAQTTIVERKHDLIPGNSRKRYKRPSLVHLLLRTYRKRLKQMKSYMAYFTLSQIHRNIPFPRYPQIFPGISKQSYSKKPNSAMFSFTSSLWSRALHITSEFYMYVMCELLHHLINAIALHFSKQRRI